MFLTEKLKEHFSNIRQVEDHSEVRLSTESSIMLPKRGPCEKSFSLSLFSY